MWSFSVATILLPLFVMASPLAAPVAEPLTAGVFVDFPVNVIMTAGAAQFGMWVPRDGILYSLSDLTCLNAGTNSYGSCGIMSVDQVGVVAGNGPCTFIGTNGFYTTMSGAAGSGFQSIAPPQTLAYASCGP